VQYILTFYFADFYTKTQNTLCFRKSRAPCRQSFCLDFNSADQGEGDLVLGVDRHAVNQRGSLACIEFGVELRQGLDQFYTANFKNLLFYYHKLHVIIYLLRICSEWEVKAVEEA
jgi:hypothetical protein